MPYPAYRAPLIPRAFVWRRVHSLTGLWLVLFLIEHLFTNSQAALFIGDDGSGFVTAVNSLKNLPYLPVIEIFLLGVPFLIHGIWGILYLFSAEYNSFGSDGTKPNLSENPRNHAYTWQRITSWILLFGIIAHVIQMRILEYPVSVMRHDNHLYVTRVENDEGLHTLSKRLKVELYHQMRIEEARNQALEILSQAPSKDLNTTHENARLAQNQRKEQAWISALDKWPLRKDQILAVSPSFGVAELLMVRDTFKSSTMIFLYSLFVLAACFHGFNGLWTFMISWGITLTARSQLLMRRIAVGFMILITSLGFAAIWGTYWFNLTH